MKTKTKFLRFLSDTSGNIAMMAAIGIPVLLIIVGASVSLTDAHNRTSNLQSHSDHLSLAMAKYKAETDEGDASNYFNNYIATELKPGETCTYELNESPAQAIVTCMGEMDSFLAGALDKKTVPYSVKSIATMDTPMIFEVAFVFDISDSMVGQEITDLKSSLTTIADSEMFAHGDSRLSLIPFANTVRLGSHFEKYVTPGTGYEASGGIYNGCFDREATDPSLNLKSNPTFPLVTTTLGNGRIVCPYEDMTAVFHKEATDWEIKDFERNIEISYGTGMSDALVWGFRSLDPNLRGVLSTETKYPLDNSKTVTKHIIMMTDGRPYDRPWTGPGGGAVTQQLSLDRFESVCDELPFTSNDINFHLINYNNNSLSDEHIDIYKNCVSGEGQFHEAESGELTSVINAIIGELSALRLSR